jgi:methylenetetrahydrofolate reductase (NADPH)
MSAQSQYKKKFSFEFFPPRTDDARLVLEETQQNLKRLGPDFFSVTYGAGGSEREKTLETALSVRDSTSIPVAPHITCVNSTRDELALVLEQYQELAFSHLVVLRGDLPDDGSNSGDFKYASDLVSFIRERCGDIFEIDVACYPEFHPETNNADAEFDNFMKKVDAGADGAITQYFYNPSAYFEFIEECERRNIRLPVVPGIMPITNHEQLVRFSAKCGAEIPRWILRRLETYGDDLESIRNFGLEVVTELCQTLLEFGAPGLHIYSMNRHSASEKIWQNLDLR